ncbi:MAG: hypothetical protein Q7K57_47500 [Burkholderiaceae bacterium]|nr:hypothetical protein [Burkholderiaceae bacterium]
MSTATTCINCGCTDLQACPGGCSWLGVNHRDGTGVCSRCPKALTAWRAQQANQTTHSRDASQRELVQIGPTDI